MERGLIYWPSHILKPKGYDYMREIGSEFHLSGLGNGSGIRFPRNGMLTFSGRTAIETVLAEIPFAQTALLPSYCCDSMIEPFRRAGITIDFFDVNYNGSLTVEIKKKADILLWCNYFGFKNEIPEFDGIIIEDITHSLFSDVQCHNRSDYLVASVRKWEPIYCGGYCTVVSKLRNPPNFFLEDKNFAMRLKKQYLNDGDIRKKSEFLSKFKSTNTWLADNYSGLGIDDYSKNYLTRLDIDIHKEIRRRNATFLYENLSEKINFLFPVEQMDCPLFVPIVLKKGRQQIQKYLANNEIYCPMHWPLPNADCKSNLYDTELSLVCDHRYDLEDMKKVVKVLSQIII